MPAVRLLAGTVLALPTALLVDRAATLLIADRPLFRSATAPRVAPRAVLVGAVLAVANLLVGIRFLDASWLELLAYLALVAVLALLSVVDVAEYRLPDVVVLPSIVAGVILVALVSIIDGEPGRIRPALVGAAIAFAVLLIAHLVSPRGMGFGDVKLALLLGLAVGWQGTTAVDASILVLWMLLIGFGAGSLGGVLLWIVRRGNQPFPFGPFLAFGTLVTVLLSRTFVG